jgi:hypothetical protein
VASLLNNQSLDSAVVVLEPGKIDVFPVFSRRAGNRLRAAALKYACGVTLIQTPMPLLAATIGLSGVLFLLLGIIAEIQLRIYFEACGRPPYKIRQMVQHPALPRLRMVPAVVAASVPRSGIGSIARPRAPGLG